MFGTPPSRGPPSGAFVAVEPDDVPDDASDDIPDGVPDDGDPVDASGEAPDDEALDAPDDAPDDVPAAADAPDKAPDDEALDAPDDDALGNAPDEDAPEDVPDPPEGDAADDAPDDGPDDAPDEAPDDAPDEAPDDEAPEEGAPEFPQCPAATSKSTEASPPANRCVVIRVECVRRPTRARAAAHRNVQRGPRNQGYRRLRLCAAESIGQFDEAVSATGVRCLESSF